MEHKLKTWPDYFYHIIRGNKRFEIRKDDRDFKVDDILVLMEYDPLCNELTGSWVKCKVTYKLDGGLFGLERGYCLLGIKVGIKYVTKRSDSYSYVSEECRLADEDVGQQCHNCFGPDGDECTCLDYTR